MDTIIPKETLVTTKKLQGKQIPITDTLIFAKRFGIRHKHILEKCKDILELSDKLNQPNFRPIKNHIILSSYRDSKKRKYPKYLLTQRGFTTLLMEISTPKNLEAKKRLFITRQLFIDAFELMQQKLLNSQSEEWRQLREQGKIARRLETDTIKEFVEYATSQGSKNAKFYYKHFTNATYKALKLLQAKDKTNKVRDALDMFQLHQLFLAEKIVSDLIEREMKKGTHYKSIYEKAKDKLLEFADIILIDKPKELK
jgi:Rha family phage regulatory protein